MKKVALYLSIIIIIGITGFRIYTLNQLKDIPITNPNLTGSIITGDNTSGGIITGNIIGKYELKILNIPFENSSNEIYAYDYPKIKINKPIENIKIEFDVDFTDNFKQSGKKYINSNGYFFAFKFFLGDKNNGGFIDVFRNKNDGVGNSTNGNLNGAKLGKDISGGTLWSVGNEVKIAQPAGIYGYTTAYPKNYINSQVGNIIHIGGHLSSVTEMKGWKFTKINQITITYEGEEGAIEVVK